MTTPRATSMDSTVSFRIPFEFFTCSASFHIFIRSDGFVRSRIHFLLSPRNTGSLRKNTRYKALPFYPPETTRDRSTHVLSARKNKKRKPPDMGNFRKAPTAVPTLALSKSGHRSKVTPSSQPVTQAPVCSVFWVIIHLPAPDCKRELSVRPSLPARAALPPVRVRLPPPSNRPDFRTIILKSGLRNFFDNLRAGMYNVPRNTEGVLGHAILENERSRQ